MKSVYYAHAFCVYGTLCEQAEIRVIRNRFKKHRIVNPAHYSDHPEKRRDTMGFCLRLVEGCEIVVFSRILGKVTAGVGKEVNHALKIGKRVYEVTRNGLIRRYRALEYLSRARSRSLYRTWWDVRGGNAW